MPARGFPLPDDRRPMSNRARAGRRRCPVPPRFIRAITRPSLNGLAVAATPATATVTATAAVVEVGQDSALSAFRAVASAKGGASVLVTLWLARGVSIRGPCFPCSSAVSRRVKQREQRCVLWGKQAGSSVFVARVCAHMLWIDPPLLPPRHATLTGTSPFRAGWIQLAHANGAST